jgi:hypothetical protein
MYQNRDFSAKIAILVILAPKMAVLVIFGPSAPTARRKFFWPILEPIPKNG